MRHISTRLVSVTVFLVALALVTVVAVTLYNAKNQSSEYAFEKQVLESRLIARELELDIGRLKEISMWVDSIPADATDLPVRFQAFIEQAKQNHLPLTGVGILRDTENAAWIDFPELSISKYPPPPVKLDETSLLGAEPGIDSIIYFHYAHATVALKMNFERIKSLCANLPLALIQKTGQPFFFCNAQISKRMKYAQDSLNTVMNSKLESGFTSQDDLIGTSFWAYTDVGNLGRLISVVDQVDIYRDIYVLGLKSTILIVFILGLVILVSVLIAKSLTAPIQRLTEVTQKFAEGDFDAEVKIGWQDETGLLAESVQIMAQKTKELIKREIERTKLEEQLAMAGAVQKMLLPDPAIQVDSVLIHSFYQTADECGGDWWSYVRGEKKLAVFVGDVTGHGYASALLVAAARGFISMLQDEKEKNGDLQLSPSDMLTTLNRVVYEATRTQLNMTAMCVLIDLESGKYQLASAGHNPAYQLTAKNQVVSVNGSGPRLGEQLKIADELFEAEGILLPGDRLVLYTDGIQELGTEEKPLGRKGFKAFLQSHVSLSGQAMIDAMQSQLMATHQGSLPDDVTFLILERKNA